MKIAVLVVLMSMAVGCSAYDGCLKVGEERTRSIVANTMNIYKCSDGRTVSIDKRLDITNQN